MLRHGPQRHPCVYSNNKRYNPMSAIIALKLRIVEGLDRLGAYIAAIPLRLFLAWEFWEAGVIKFQGENWFGEVASQFPFPFNVIPVSLSWNLAMWTELLAPIGLVLGLGTRFWAVALIVLDVVAWYSVHAAHGYNVCDNGYKLPLIYLVMLIALLFSGPGRLSLDHWLRTRLQRAH